MKPLIFKNICLNPIGYVQNKLNGKEVKDKKAISKIILDEKFKEGLDGIKEFSHVFILFWLNKISKENRCILKVHPRGRRDMPLLGIFATRTPNRPNPIGLTLVKLINVEKNVLTVQGLDAFDGTPILDIKPFDDWDLTTSFTVPDWLNKLNKEKIASC